MRRIEKFLLLKNGKVSIDNGFLGLWSRHIFMRSFFWKQPLIMKHFAVLEFFDFLKGTLSVNPWITVLFGLPI